MKIGHSEHFKSFITNKTDYNYSNHHYWHDNYFNIHFDILPTQSRGLKLNFCEALEIKVYKNSQNLFND